MGNTTGAQVQEPTEIEKEGPSKERSPDIGKFSMVPTMKKRTPCCTILNIAYGALSVVTILECIASIAVAVSTAIAIKAYSSQQSGRVVAMIVLAVIAAISMSMVIYGLLAVIRKQTKPLHATAVVLIILMIIQSIICGVSVIPTTQDETNLSRSLSESFRFAKDQNPKHVKLWSVTQNNLNCCGVYGPNDYRTRTLPKYFAPDVPIACCPTYDPDRSELVQERERETCKARREYFDIGCNAPILELFRYTGELVLWVTVILIVSEGVMATLGLIIFQRQLKLKKSRKEVEDTKGDP